MPTRLSIEILSIGILEIDVDSTGQGGSRVAWLVSIGPGPPFGDIGTDYRPAGVSRRATRWARGNCGENQVCTGKERNRVHRRERRGSRGAVTKAAPEEELGRWGPCELPNEPNLLKNVRFRR